MIRVTRLTDYAVVLLTHITRGVRGCYTVGLHCGMLMLQDPGMLAIAMGIR